MHNNIKTFTPLEAKPGLFISMSVQKQLNVLSRRHKRTHLLSKVIIQVMRATFPESTLAKFDKKFILVNDVHECMIDEISRVSVTHLLAREITSDDHELITDAWYKAYRSGMCPGVFCS